MGELVGLGIEARSAGAGNFVCVRVPGERTAELTAELEARAIFVLDIGARFPRHVRITSRVVEALVAAVSGCRETETAGEA